MTTFDIYRDMKARYSYKYLCNEWSTTYWKFINVIRQQNQNYNNQLFLQCLYSTIYLDSNKIKEDKFRNYDVYLATNPNINIEDYIKITSLDKITLGTLLSMNNSLKPEHIERYPHLNWDYQVISRNNNFSEKYILNTLTKKNWNIYNLGKNSAIHFNTYISLIKKYYGNDTAIYMCNNPIDCIESFSTLTWFELNDFITNQTHISRNLWKIISRHPSVTWEIYCTYKEYPWDISGLSQNKNITPDIIEANLDIEWNWYKMSSNSSITEEFICKYRTKKWNFYKLCENNSLGPSLFYQFLKEIKPIYLTHNNMIVARKRWINKLRINIIKAIKIQRIYRRAMYNPEYKLFHKFKMKRYLE